MIVVGVPSSRARASASWPASGDLTDLAQAQDQTSRAKFCLAQVRKKCLFSPTRVIRYRLRGALPNKRVSSLAAPQFWMSVAMKSAVFLNGRAESRTDSDAVGSS